MSRDTQPEVRLREATESDSGFCYRAKVAAHKDNIVATYGPWDEAEQRAYHEKQWSPCGVRIISADGCDAGWVWCADARECVEVNGFYILPSHQRKGIGTLVMRQVLAEAGAAGKAVRLAVMKANSALAFYRKLGFAVVGETETHFEVTATGRS
jgi:GNAT superfamily N-acetyltransferase